MRSFQAIAASLFALSVVSVQAQPYGWVLGSSADSPNETGNKLALVDLGTGALVGPSGGVTFTTESGGADPLVPTFWRDGSRAYILVGGDEDLPPPRNGHLYVFDSQAVRTAVAASSTPSFLQKVTFVATSDSAIEPTGVTISPTHNYGIVTESEYNTVFVIPMTANGTFNTANATLISTTSDPSPAWINNAGTRAYFCESRVYSGNTVLTDAVVKVINLENNPPNVVATVNVPPPNQGAGILGILKTIPVTTCAFPVPAGAIHTIVQPPETDVADDSELYIYSGYAGFVGKSTIPFPQNIALSDTWRVYRLNTSDNTLDGGTHIAEVSQSSALVAFPPLVHPFRKDNGSTISHVAGTIILKPNDSWDDIEPQDPWDEAFLFGLMNESEDSLFIGTVSGANIDSLITGTYQPLHTTSNVYRQVLNGATLGALTPVASTDRSMTVVAGFTTDRVVLVATDGFFVFTVPGAGDATVSRKTQVALLNPSSSTITNTIDTGLVAGAYAQQPLGVPAGVNEVVKKLLDQPATASDDNGDGIIDAADIRSLING